MRSAAEEPWKRRIGFEQGPESQSGWREFEPATSCSQIKFIQALEVAGHSQMWP
jgi:hypothetical protein